MNRVARASTQSGLGLLLLALATGMVAATAGCSKTSAQDQQTTASVQSRLAADPALQGETITAHTDNGVVKLTGTVRSENDRMSADQDAQVAGVTRVDNQLAVNPSLAANSAAGTTAAPGSALPADSGVPQSQQPEQPAPAPAQDNAETVRVPPGTELSVRLDHSLSSATSQPGETFQGRLSAPVVVHDQVVIPRGAGVSGTVVAVDAAGHFEGRSRLQLRLTALEFGGQSYDLSTHSLVRETEPEGKRSGEVIGGAAGVGAVIGAIAGHGKGAAIGALSGAAGGTAAQELTKAPEVEIPAESVLTFTLSDSLHVVPVH